MLSVLSTLSESLGLSFEYGNRGTFNVKVDSIATFPLLYSEGYAEGVINVDPTSGELTDVYSLSLWLFQPQPYSSAPTERSEQIEQLRFKGKQLLTRLLKTCDLSTIQFIVLTAVPMVDKDLDGVRFQFTATPKVQNAIC